MALLTYDDVIQARFKQPKDIETGYDADEVDWFLDQVAEAVQQLTKERDAAIQRAEVAEAKVTEVQGSGDGQGAPADSAESSTAFAPQAVNDGTANAQSAAGVILLAQQLHDKYVAEGQQEHDRLIGEAREKGDKLVAEAEATHNRTLAQLEQERGLQERKISELRDFERDYRTRLKSYLGSLLQNVEQGGQDPVSSNNN